MFSILIFLFLLFQVTGTLGKLVKWISNTAFGSKLTGILKKLELLDQGISFFYRQHTPKVVLSIFYAFVGWLVGLIELYVTLYFLGYKLSLVDLWVIEALTQLVRNGSFFIPLSIGALEGGFLLIFTAMGMPSTLGITVSFVYQSH